MLNASALALAVALLAAPAAPRRPTAPAIQAGPMIGYVTLREAAIWVQTTAPASVELRYRPLGEAVAPRARVPWPANATPAPLPPAATPRAGTRVLRTDAGSEHIATFVLDDLEPNTRYEAALLLDGKPVRERPTVTFATQPLWQWRHEPPDFTAMIGSCLYVNETPYNRPGIPYGGEYEILQAMAAQKPDLMVWLGDNTYTREVDYLSPAGLARRYRHDRALPELAALLAAAPQYATWDDHDFGPNDSDGSYLLKEDALRLFTLYWPAPRYGAPGVPGVFQKLSWSDVDFFLLDDRYHRKPNRWPAGSDRRMLGEAQMQWLKESLVASSASFKVVAIGNQVLNPLNTGEALPLYPVEYQELLDLLRAARVPGVVFLSGDVHRTELIKVQPEGLYPLYDFTSSPLTSGVSVLRPDHPQFANPSRVPGTLLMERSFGTLRVEGPPAARRLILRAHDKTGAVRWTHTIERAELGWR